jgi:sugar-specific transcriptional regulator TrmB
VDDSLIGQLIGLGLSGYEARAYVALTTHDRCTAAEAARLAALPRQRIYDVLASLVAKGFASILPGASVRYRATEPAQAIGQLMAAQRQRLELMEEQAAAMIETLSPIFRAGQQKTDPLGYVEILHETNAINARFDELQASVKKELLIFTRPPYARQPQDNVEGLPLARSHKVRSIYEFSLFEDLAASEGVRRFVRAGEEARVVPELPLKLVVIDEAIVMIGMQDPVAASNDLTIMVVEHPSLARVLKTAFNAYWEQGLTFDQAYEQFAKSGAESA